MTRKIRLTSRLILMFVIPLFALAAESKYDGGMLDRAAVIKSADLVTTEKYPNADDVLIDDFIRVEYQADGTSVTWDDEFTKVLTEKGKREHRTRSLHFTLPYGTAEVLILEIIKPDGSIVPIDIAEQSRVMVDRAQMSANIYNPNSKILNIGLPALEVGDVYHILTRMITVKPRVPDTWSDYSVFEYTNPIKHLTYEVSGPKERPLKKIVLKDEIPGTVSYTSSSDETRVLYRWEVKDVPRAFSEPNMPPLYTVVQRLLVSTIPEWNDISSWYWDLCEPHLDAVNDAMRKKVSELTDGVEAPNEKISRLFQFVSQQIRYMGITTETEAPGYEPHDARVTFDNKYGVCRDKGALLVSMLRLSGFKAYPVIIHAGPKKDEEVPQPYFNHAIVAVEDPDGSYQLMDPTDENTTALLPAYLSNKSYLVAHPEGETLLTSAIVPAEENLLKIDTTGALSPSGELSARSVLYFEGINDNAYRGYFSRIKPEERKRFFEGAIKRRMPGATLTSFLIEPEDTQDTSVPLTVTLDYSVQDYLVSGDGHALLQPPWLGTTLGYVNFILGHTGLPKRRFPLFTKVACGVTESFSIDVQHSVESLLSSPKFSPIESDSLVFASDIRFATNQLFGASRFLVKAVEFSEDEYLQLKQQLKDIEFARRKNPVFSVPTESQHDVENVFIRNVYDIKDAHSWTRTQTLRKRILTYAGKKTNSELKLKYNPTWESVSITRATVTNPDGSVHEIVDEEVNLMDAAWVGKAPRYPAAKTMVVSLPAVEIGSYIDYTVVRRIKDRPFFSVRLSFGSFDPVLTNRLVVSCPSSLNIEITNTAENTIAFSETESGSLRICSWEAINQKVIPKEDSLPPSWTFNPTVFVSAGDWSTYAAALRAKLLAAARGQDKARALARDLVNGVKDPTKKLVLIRDYIARNVRKAGPLLTNLPFSSISNADITLADAYGNNADRAILHYTMLKEAGFRPDFILTSSWAPRIGELSLPLLETPQRSVFDFVLVRVEHGGSHVYLGDTDQYARLGSTAFHDRPGLSMKGQTFPVEAQENQRPRDSRQYDIHIKENGDALVTVTQKFFGMAFAAFHRRFAEFPPEERRRHYPEVLGRLSQAAEAETELQTNYLDYPGTQSFTARIPRYAVRSDDFLYVTLPGQLPGIASLRAATRTAPLYNGKSLKLDAVYRVFLPDSSGGVRIAPRDTSWNAPFGLGSVHCTTEVVDVPANDEPSVLIARRLDLDSAVTPASYYPALLDIDRKLRHPESQTILLTVK